MAQDPVCRMHVEEGRAAATKEYQGRKYYFCSKGCLARFIENPGKYVAREERGKKETWPPPGGEEGDEP